MPLVREIPWAEPVDLLAAVAGDRYAALLHSRGTDPRAGHSFLALEPFRVLTCREGRFAADGVTLEGHPLELLRAELALFRLERAPEGPPFQGGAVGFFGYELARVLEDVPVPPARGDEPPEMVLMLCDVVVAFDHGARRAVICSSGLPERDEDDRRARAESRLEEVARRVARADPAPSPALPVREPDIVAERDRPQYEAAVRRVIDYILAGDIFQANISQGFETDLPDGVGPLDLYRRLQEGNPAPFSAYLALDGLVIASSSPERFLQLRGDRVETRPIKGTRPRGATPDADEALAAELSASEKDRAENVMIVDLLRNDLSKVCADGTVEVPELCALERFATVMHLVSAVTGCLRPGLGAVDLLSACFPGGSITGAPKIRAMQIIAELEGRRRGPYCGAIGYLGFDGDLDTSVAIRTFVISGGRVRFRAGGGVVADSRPEDEYDEVVAKARALCAALSP